MKKKILAIIGSASDNSSNLKLVNHLAASTQHNFEWNIFDGLKELPHFNPELSVGNPPIEIINFRNAVLHADGIIICTPEYVFSIPSGLKNAIEWCVATTVFSQKPVGLIVASASGIAGLNELKLIMKTVYAKLSTETALLIQGIKGKIDEDGNVTDAKTAANLKDFIKAYKGLIEG
jgi:NAD(P)H-dependent FMN reductase